jgi:hypothetical protein
MRTSRLLLLGALVLPVAAVPAHADQAVAALSRVPTYATLRPTADTLKLQKMLVQADEASVSGRSGQARKLYRSIVQEQRNAAVYAGTALWRLAGVQLFDGKVYDAVITLEETAQEAARFGDPTMELRASFEAAVLWQKSKRNADALRNLERVRCLLQSPAVAAELKADIERRIVE